MTNIEKIARTIETDPWDGAELGPQESGGQSDRTEADHGEGVPTADLGAEQALERGPEAAGDARTVEKGDEVGQHDAVAFLGKDEVGVAAVPLPAVRRAPG